MREFNPIMINLTYFIQVPGSAGGSFREAEVGSIYLGSDGYYYAPNEDGTITQFSADFIPIIDYTQNEFDALAVTLTEFIWSV